MEEEEEGPAEEVVRVVEVGGMSAPIRRVWTSGKRVVTLEAVIVVVAAEGAMVGGGDCSSF